MTLSTTDAPRGASALASTFSAAMLGRTARDAVVKLDPRRLTGNPVIFTTEIVALLPATDRVQLAREDDVLALQRWRL